MLNTLVFTVDADLSSPSNLSQTLLVKSGLWWYAAV